MCNTTTNNCDSNAMSFCTHTPGSFTCTCNHGYTGNGTTCKGKKKENLASYFTLPNYQCKPIQFTKLDIDECADATTNKCDSNATCTSTPGSFTCTCNQGYTSIGLTCEGMIEVIMNYQQNIQFEQLLFLGMTIEK